MTLPEVLRLAPNLQVAQVNGASYAITARGLNGGGNSAPNKLLVLIDGRSVYTPLFSGVFWDVQDLMLEDIERIEVISGTAVRFANLLDGHALGIEMWGSFQATKSWRLSGGLTAMRERLYLDPSHSLQLRTAYSIDAGREVALSLRKVGALDSGPVPGYTALDARFGWRVRRGLELSVAAINLNGSHPEYGSIATRSEVPRTVAVRLVWHDQ